MCTSWQRPTYTVTVMHERRLCCLQADERFECDITTSVGVDRIRYRLQEGLPGVVLPLENKRLLTPGRSGQGCMATGRALV